MKKPSPYWRPLAATLPLLMAMASPAAAQGDDPDIPDGFVLTNGDIILPEDYAPTEGVGCGMVETYNPVAWAVRGTQGVVPFIFDAGVSSANRTAMKQAMDIWSNSGPDIAFVPISNPDAMTDRYVTIQSSTGNNSGLGMFGPGQNVINIFNWGFPFIMAHELSHNFGFWHEQARPDRNDFVTIQCANVCQDCCSGGSCSHQFRRQANWLTLATPYDFGSVMHYGQCFFSTDNNCPTSGQTIIVDAPNQAQQGLIGQRTQLSAMDVQDMIDAYGAGIAPRYVENAASGAQTGTLATPYSSVAQAEASAATGTTIWVKGGLYAEAPITLSAVGIYRPYFNDTVKIE